MTLAVGTLVSPTVGPYEGRIGVVKSRLPRLPEDRVELVEVELRASTYAGATTGKFDPRNLRQVEGQDPEKKGV